MRGLVLAIVLALALVPARSGAAPRVSGTCCLNGPNAWGTCKARAAGPVGSPCTCFAYEDLGRLC